MALSFEKTSLHIAPPPGNKAPSGTPGDVVSGMQKSTCNGTIGAVSTVAAEDAAGQSIGFDAAVDYHKSIAGSQALSSITSPVGSVPSASLPTLVVSVTFTPSGGNSINLPEDAGTAALVSVDGQSATTAVRQGGTNVYDFSGFDETQFVGDLQIVVQGGWTDSAGSAGLGTSSTVSVV